MQNTWDNYKREYFLFLDFLVSHTGSLNYPFIFLHRYNACCWYELNVGDTIYP